MCIIIIHSNRIFIVQVINILLSLLMGYFVIETRLIHKSILDETEQILLYAMLVEMSQFLLKILANDGIYPKFLL